MKFLESDLYKIKDLRVVLINKDYIEYRKNDFINYFNNNVKFIVEKTVIEDQDQYGNHYYAEYYTECITEEDLSIRESSKPFRDIPKIFSLVSRIPFEYLTKEEIESGEISVKRIYKVLQDINIRDDNKKTKTKKIGKKK